LTAEFTDGAIAGQAGGAVPTNDSRLSLAGAAGSA
jgi:hypothetical protein